jgi:hypothetical protein
VLINSKGISYDDFEVIIGPGEMAALALKTGPVKSGPAAV